MLEWYYSGTTQCWFETPGVIAGTGAAQTPAT
jgi:hypothetical protein